MNKTSGYDFFLPTPSYRMLLLLWLTVIPAGFTVAQSGAPERISLALEEGKSGSVWDCAVSPKGSVAFSCGRDSTVKAWNTSTGECIRVMRAEKPTLMTCLTLSPDGKQIASGDMNGAVTVWDAELGQTVTSFQAHDAYITGIEFTPSGRSFVTSARDGMVYVWDTDVATRRISIDAASVWVNAIALAPDGGTIVTAGQDGSIRAWDTYTGKAVLTYGMHSRFARSVAFSRDGKTLLSGGRDGEVKVWDAKSGVSLRSFRMENGYPHDLTVDPKSTRVIVSTANSIIEIWDWKPASRVSALGGSSYGAMAAALSPDGTRLYSAHADGALKVWFTKSWMHAANLVGFSDGQWLSFTPDGFYDCSSYGDRYVQWKSGEEYFPLQQYEAIYHKSSVIEDALAGNYTPEKTLGSIAAPPVLRLIAPRHNQIFAFGAESLEIVVEVEAEDARGVDAIALALNGRAVPRQNILETSTIARTERLLRQRFRVSVLPGYNTIDAVAYNDLRVKSEPASAVTQVITSAERKPNLYLLAVGIDEYAPEFPNLNYASNDAAAIAETFSRQEGKMYQRVYTKVLANKEASRDKILAALGQFPPMSSQDVLVLFFSGHGVRARGERGGNEYFYVSSGAAKKTMSKSGMSWSTFTEKLAQTQAGRVVMLLDACHSGAVSEGASNEKVAASLAAKVGVVFASSSGNEFSFEDASWRHGAFTKAILGALDGQADYTKDNIIDWNEFQLYVTNTVKTLTKGSQHPMIPRLEQFGNFDLVRLQ